MRERLAAAAAAALAYHWWASRRKRTAKERREAAEAADRERRRKEQEEVITDLPGLTMATITGVWTKTTSTKMPPTKITPVLLALLALII